MDTCVRHVSSSFATVTPGYSALLLNLVFISSTGLSSRKSDHITDSDTDMHLLTIEQRSKYKILAANIKIIIIIFIEGAQLAKAIFTGALTDTIPRYI